MSFASYRNQFYILKLYLTEIYKRIPGKYSLQFEFEDGHKEILKFEILKSNFKLRSLTDEVYIEKDDIQLINKGSILHFKFKFAGLITLDTVDIYFKTYFLNDNDKSQNGVFSGIDNENRLVNGTLTVNYS